MAAFQSAIEQGASGIELDVFLTNDEQLVVFHDKTLERMTNGQGCVTSFSLVELQELRLENFNGGLSDAQIPNLDDVLDLVARFRDRHARTTRARDFVVNIELKGHGIPVFLADCLEKRLQSGWSPHDFLISSFDMNSLRQMKRERADIPIGALLVSSSEPWDIEEGDLNARLANIEDIQSATVNITLPSLTAGTTGAIRRAGAAPVVWTYDEVNPDRLKTAERRRLSDRLLSNEVTAIITDFPAQMRRLLDACEP